MIKRYLFGLILLVLFVPKVYAFTYEVNADVSRTSVETGTKTEIIVSLKNVKGTDYGIGSCSLDIEFSNGILLNSKIRTLNSWTLTTGEFYLFDTGNPIKDNGEMFVIPITVNNVGSVKIFNIKCSDGDTLVQVNDKLISFDVDNIQNGSDDEEVLDSNCDLSNIVFSEGTIEFNPDVSEYNLKVTNYDELIITPILVSDKASFSVFKNENNKIIITVNAQDGSEKIYTVYVKEVSSSEVNGTNDSYVPFFIGVICILLLINIIRIIVNKVRKK